MKWLMTSLALFWIAFAPAQAQNLVGLARMTDLEFGTGLSGTSQIEIGLTQSVPYSVTLLSDPMRVRVSFMTADFPDDQMAQQRPSGDFSAIQAGANGKQETWLDFQISAPMGLDRAEMTTMQTGARLDLRFVPLAAQTFESLARVTAEPTPAVTPADVPRRNSGDRPWVIALDPGHGGIDPGADGGGRSEADLMLLFAFELRDALRRDGYDVVLTRQEDRFVGLEGRVSAARDAKADVFVSLHADVVLEGFAEGVTVYTLSERASSEADAKLAARHDRHDILGGVDFDGQGDEVAQVLMDMVRRETRPRSESLAEAIYDAMKGTMVATNSNPIRKGDFAVLRAADIPSVLVELGFLSSPSDLERLSNPEGRAKLIAGILSGLETWTLSDAAAAALIRQ